ncbi:MAG: N5-glutamine methyltransferase family protein, partial [Acidimicrobiales bacterium]
MIPSWRDLLAEVSSGLGGSPSPHEESRLILQHAARMPWPALAARLDEPAAPKVAARARHLAAARRGGRPLQHVLGRWGFRRIDVAVDGRALVPRPETEVVVEVALELVEALGISGRPVLAVDLGTGSGVIALSLATERDDLDAVGVDRSADALALAAENLTLVSAAHPGLAARVSFLRGDFYGALRPGMRGAVDLVVANPPYVAEREWAGLEPVVRDHDPYEALVAGPS